MGGTNKVTCVCQASLWRLMLLKQRKTLVPRTAHDTKQVPREPESAVAWTVSCRTLQVLTTLEFKILQKFLYKICPSPNSMSGKKRMHGSPSHHAWHEPHRNSQCCQHCMVGAYRYNKFYFINRTLDQSVLRNSQ
jgi:hypothetical protein